MIDLVIEQRRRDLGGFEVGRVLPIAVRRSVGPFVFFDHMGPATFAAGIPKSMDVRPHPHIGLSTVTYLFAGEIMHRDSVGSEQAIKPAEVNWMVAGSGITHSERFEQARQFGGGLHGIQAWVALPNEHEETAPAFYHYDADALPNFQANGLSARLIAGSLFGATASVLTHSPMFYVDWQLQAGVKAGLPAEYPERAAYIASGTVEIGGREFSTGQMPIFHPGETIVVTAKTDARVMLLGGESVGPRFIDWNFVSSSKDRIEQAKSDWRQGRMKLPDLDNGEFIPLPSAD